MKSKFKGTVTSIFPDDINTDDIIPAWTLQESTERKFFAQFAFLNYDPEFVKRCGQNTANIIVSGKNFGCGSSREQAVYALQENNVTAVIAESFPDIFYRNALNNGLILITFSNTMLFKIGNELVIDLKNNQISCRNKSYRFEINSADADTFLKGGKINKVKHHLKEILKKGNKEIKKITNKPLPQTIVEKIISIYFGKNVFAGELIGKLPIDTLFLNEVIGPSAIKYFLSNFSVIFNPDKIFFIPDHTVPSSSVSVSEGITFMEEFAKKQGIKCYKEGDGIEHIVLMEDGHIKPGSIVLGTDSHTGTNGALNCLAFGIGTTDAVFALATGYLYDFTVPGTIRINMSGKFRKGVYAKDLILHLLGILGVDGASKKVAEFGGSALSNLSIDARTTIANMAVEMGARTAIFEYDDITKDYLKDKNTGNYNHYKPDKNCHYLKVIDVKLNELEPNIAFPHKPSNVTAITKIKEYMVKSGKSVVPDLANINSVKITDAFLGACTNGKYEDFLEASKILKGRKVHKNVNFVAIPASRKIYNQLLSNGILAIFARAGVNIESSNCGPCFGKHMGVLGCGAQIISSSNRNYIGRMGSKTAKIFLASPATVAASAVAGEITDPRKYL